MHGVYMGASESFIGLSAEEWMPPRRSPSSVSPSFIWRRSEKPGKESLPTLERRRKKKVVRHR